MSEPAAGRLLTRLFLRRFLENDLLSPSGDGHESAVFAAVALAVAGIWVSIGPVFKSVNPWVSPFDALLRALDDKYVGLAGSMIVTGLGTAIEWEALGLDRRDRAVLGPLPIPPRVLLLAKVRALAWFVTVFAVAMNGLPGLLYPPLQADSLPVGLFGVLWLVFAHLVAGLAACAFGFLAVLGCRETARAIVGPRLFHRLSDLLHFVAILLLTTALLLVVTPRVHLAERLDRHGERWSMAPPTWFVGLYETMIGPVVQPLPAESPTRKRQFWTLAQNQRARAEYVSHTGAFRRLAARAVASLLLLVAVCAAAIAVNWRRVAPAPGTTSSFRRALGRCASGLAVRGIVRHPVSQAGFFFTLQTLARSALHRACLASVLAGGIAVVVVTFGTRGPWSPIESAAAPPVNQLAVQMMLLFCLVAGLRGALARPSELRANWSFRLHWDGDARRYLAGARRAAGVGVVLPVLLVMAPAHAYAWGPGMAAWHLVLGGLAAWILLDVVLMRFGKLPFTCSYSPKGTLKTRWSWYLLAFLASTYGFCTLENLAFASARGPALLVSGLGATIAALAVYRRRRVERTLTVIFDDPPELPTLRLGVWGND